MAGIERDKLIRIPFKTLKIVAKASDFTDGGAAAGTYTSTKTIPAGAIVLGVRMQSTAGFSGDTSAALLVGKGGATDDFGGASQSGFHAAQTVYGKPQTIAEQQNAAATAVLLTVTTATDFTIVVTTGGRLLIDIFYLDLNAKPF